MSNVHVTEESRSLRCDLTNVERLEKGRALAEADAECARIEEEKGRVAAQYAAQIKTATSRRHELAGAIRQGYEFRDVTCSVQHVYSDREVLVVRLDTGEVIERRGMNPTELRQAERRAQGSLFQEDEKPQAEPVMLADTDPDAQAAKAAEGAEEAPELPEETDEDATAPGAEEADASADAQQDGEAAAEPTPAGEAASPEAVTPPAALLDCATTEQAFVEALRLATLDELRAALPRRRKAAHLAIAQEISSRTNPGGTAKNEDTEGQETAADATEPAPAAPGETPDDPAPAVEGAGEGFTEEAPELPPERPEEEPTCESCGHAERVHGDTGMRGCMVEDCGCRKLRVPLDDPDPLRLDGYDPKAEKREADDASA
jgi:hypothetical protein